jgi:hypothetical protein
MTDAQDAIERLRDTMASQTGGGITCMDADDARAILAHIDARTVDEDTMQRAWLALHSAVLITRTDADGTITVIDPTEFYLPADGE